MPHSAPAGTPGRTRLRHPGWPGRAILMGMSGRDGDPRADRGAGGFRVPCPCCSGGVRMRARLGVRADRSGTGHISETCQDCGGLGWLTLALKE